MLCYIQIYKVAKQIFLNKFPFYIAVEIVVNP